MNTLSSDMYPEGDVVLCHADALVLDGWWYNCISPRPVAAGRCNPPSAVGRLGNLRYLYNGGFRSKNDNRLNHHVLFPFKERPRCKTRRSQYAVNVSIVRPAQTWAISAA